VLKAEYNPEEVRIYQEEEGYAQRVKLKPNNSWANKPGDKTNKQINGSTSTIPWTQS
jgi:hypothetical protein